MRATMLAAAAGVVATVLATPGWAAPAAPHALAAGNPAVTLVRGGCGPGWHPIRRCWPGGCRWICVRNW